MKDKCKTPSYKKRPFITRLLATVKLKNNFEKNVIFSIDSRKTHNLYICRLGFFSLLPIFPHVFIALCLKWSHTFQSKQTIISSCLCLVTRHMFWSTCLTKHGRQFMFTHPLTSFISFTPSLIVKGLPMCNFRCETCFCQIFWQFRTGFLCLANLTFRFLVTRLCTYQC